VALASRPVGLPRGELAELGSSSYFRARPRLAAIPLKERAVVYHFERLRPSVAASIDIYITPSVSTSEWHSGGGTVQTHQPGSIGGIRYQTRLLRRLDEVVQVAHQFGVR
jgi:hypothetical protein